MKSRARQTVVSLLAANRTVGNRAVPLIVLAILAGAATPARAVPLDPLAFASLGTLNVMAGTLTFDTDTLQVTGGGGLGSTTGVNHVQGGGAPDIGVFAFDSIDIGGGVTVQVTGSRPLALLSRAAATIGATIDVGGADGVATSGGSGVAGGGRGGNGGPFSSTQDGAGPGGGAAGRSSASASAVKSGAGGGFGTDGGDGGNATTSPGGAAYGDPLRDLLFAGSGGGGGGGQNVSNIGAGGGAGGGALEIGAQTLLEFTGAMILANGGDGADAGGGTVGKDGGAGSGGGLLFHAFDITVDAASLIQANGGVGGLLADMGGCGGAGRVEFVHNTDGNADIQGTAQLLGGTTDCDDGAAVITALADIGEPPTEPPTQMSEPAGLALFGFGLAGLVFMRRRRAA